MSTVDQSNVAVCTVGQFYPAYELESSRVYEDIVSSSYFLSLVPIH